LVKTDQRCHPLSTVPWSPALQQAYLLHRYWIVTRTAKRLEVDFSEILKTLEAWISPNLINKDPDIPLSKKLRHAQKALRKAKREAEHLRQKHLELLLNQAVAANQHKKSQALKYLIRAERNRQCYARFRHNTKPKSSGSLAFVTVKDANGVQQPLLEQDEIEDTLLEYSRTQFAKAEGSPFTQAPLNHLLQYDGLTAFGESVFKGWDLLTHHQFDEPTRAILQNMHNKLPTTNHPPQLLDYELLMNGIKKWPERTTMSPSGRHLGIYKTLQKHVRRKKSDNPNQQKMMDNEEPLGALKQGRDVLFLIFDIMSLAIKHTYLLQRWCTVWTMFIEKEMGNPDIEQLRCIMIFEADWQLLLKWYSLYGFLPITEKAGTLAVEQGGGRKGRSAIDQAMQQVLETELVHLKQTSTIDLYLDLRACFDMMVEACHNLACRQHGADIAHLRLHARTHQLMRYYVRHKFGISTDYNTFDNHPWHGAGQGAADAALRYIVLSDTLIDAYHTKVAPIMMTDPTELIKVIRSLKAFIDDVVLHASNPTDGPLHELTTMAQTQL